MVDWKFLIGIFGIGKFLNPTDGIGIRRIVRIAGENPWDELSGVGLWLRVC